MELLGLAGFPIARWGRTMGEIRDAARTRRRILDAARQEFAAHGRAGARVEGIARRAKLQKQLIYHYFASKDALLDEVLRATLVEREAWTIPEKTPETMFRARFALAVADPVWLRFILWEAAAFAQHRRIVWRARRQAALRRQRDAIAAQQRRGTLASAFRPELLQLAMYALANYPLAFPQITKLVTGALPGADSFQKDWSDFLDQLGAALAGGGQPTAPARAGRRNPDGVSALSPARAKRRARV
jgi:TetR/AcrR family transcriptional regulator